MDNKPLAQATQPTPAAAQPQPPLSTPPPPLPQGTNAEPKSSKKMVLILVGGLILALVLIGGAYLYVSRTKTVQDQTQAPPQQDSLETELNQINIEDLEEEFATVEADLQNL